MNSSAPPLTTPLFFPRRASISGDRLVPSSLPVFSKGMTLDAIANARWRCCTPCHADRLATTTPAALPMEAHLNRYAGADTVARNCAACGGYGSIAEMRSGAEHNLARAQALGAKESAISGHFSQEQSWPEPRVADFVGD